MDRWYVQHGTLSGCGGLASRVVWWCLVLCGVLTSVLFSSRAPPFTSSLPTRNPLAPIPFPEAEPQLKSSLQWPRPQWSLHRSSSRLCVVRADDAFMTFLFCGYLVDQHQGRDMAGSGEPIPLGRSLSHTRKTYIAVRGSGTAPVINSPCPFSDLHLCASQGKPGQPPSDSCSDIRGSSQPPAVVRVADQPKA